MQRKYLEFISPSSYHVRCMTCKTVVATLDFVELYAFIVWLTEHPQEVLCFECEKERRQYLNSLVDGLVFG